MITDRPAPLALGLALLALAVAPASAHDVAANAVREVVRLQGQLGTATPAPGGLQLTFVALGKRLPFTVNEWRIFAFAEVDQQSTLPPAPELVGDRTLLRRVTTARPDQRLTILAERRPGSTDLFVLTVDRCPE